MTMWNLRPLQDFDPREHLDVAFADDEVTEAEKVFLIDLYGQYRIASGRPSDAMRADGQRAELYQLVHDAYQLVQDDRRLKTLRADLKLLADYCPYCGFAPISDLDHHLQRSRFKLLSIFALNLVPCCGPCNRGKRKIPSIESGEHQLHTYLESVTQLDFLRASASIDPDTGALSVVYSIEQCNGMSEELYARLNCHLEEFNLHEKYKKQVNIHLAEQIAGLRGTFKRGAHLLQEFLVETAEAHKENFGTNDWRTALFRGLAECEPFWSGGFEKALGKRPKA
ncbi:MULTISPECIES: hypothetical protein [Stenotrophomonas]|uniref:hypothetical protein n=1 Tax=Stenotrophomonas TaxID=40323 RepID=UPI00115FF157|nr:hypothetical protein [Stenotrophomonas maltophilia]HEL4846210.1 hypothetical protein [Stenotrophomonas maltophilia]